MNWYETLKTAQAFESPKPCADMGLLYPPFRVVIELLLAECERQGYRVRVFETYRSAKRQWILWTDGKTKLKSNGMHHYGVACDIVFLDEKDNPTWNEPFKGAWQALGNIGRRLGLFWGGDWKRFRDCPHFQACKVEEQSRVISGEWFKEN